jgi:hypothetical protein
MDNPTESPAARRALYEAHLQSLEWRIVRQAALDVAGHRCQVCNSAKQPLHGHHRTYERFGHEAPGDVTILCADCHALFHNPKPKKRRRAKRRGPVKPSEAKAARERLSASWVEESADRVRRDQELAARAEQKRQAEEHIPARPFTRGPPRKVRPM